MSDAPRSFPFFHWQSYKTLVHGGHHRIDRGFCVLTLAVAALAAARLRDQAALSQQDSRLAAVPAGAWHNACLSNLPRGHNAAADPGDAFNYLRTYALLAILSVQNAELVNFQMYLGRYLTLSAVHFFHQETRWSPDLSEVDRDERRRLVCRAA